MNKRRACATPSHSKRLKNDNIETQPKDLSVPGDLDFYIDDDGNLETLEIGSIPNTPTVTSTPVRVASPLAVSSLSFYYCKNFHYFYYIATES